LSQSNKSSPQQHIGIALSTACTIITAELVLAPRLERLTCFFITFGVLLVENIFRENVFKITCNYINIIISTGLCTLFVGKIFLKQEPEYEK